MALNARKWVSRKRGEELTRMLVQHQISGGTLFSGDPDGMWYLL